MTTNFDLAVIGSGFAGSLMATIARRLGFSVLLLEKGQHPRVVIGESSTPLSNLLLETIARRYDLPWLAPFSKWGTWQQAHPEIACGLKRGFTFFHHEIETEPAQKQTTLDRQLLVAASPNERIADTHWFRAHFDQFLMEEARAAGAHYIDNCEVRSASRENGRWQLLCQTGPKDLFFSATLLIDATGPRGGLFKLLGLEERCFERYPATSALYGHFTGVSGFQGAQQYEANGPPYPPDQAALHHVFDGGWIWVLHFNNGWTSAGCAATPEVAQKFRFAEKDAAWARLLDALPEVKSQFASAQAVQPLLHVPQLPFRSSQMAGEGWAMLPSAAGFVDPLLSTGFPLTLLGVLRLGEVLEQNWGTPQMQTNLNEYAKQTDKELSATADLIGALYANMDDFPTFRELALLYFAAASFSETVRRLGKPERASSFLLCCDATFGTELERLTSRGRQKLSRSEKLTLRHDILSLVRKFDVAGLTREPMDHCYPVRADDLFAGKDKVGATQAEIQDMLLRSGFAPE
jgi:tetracycline 7-halogenase / FADH2 O2-dependent halogenase